MLLPIINHKLHCWAWNRIYVKANGRVPCWCDSGETHTIVDNNFMESDFITDIVNSKEMRKMRLDILEKNQYYINECENCCCLLSSGGKQHKRYDDSQLANNIQQQSDMAYKMLKRVNATRKWPFGSIDKISEIQLEPSFPCNLRCPGCIHGYHKSPLTTEKPPYIFPYEWFKHMIDCCKLNNVEINRIQYCGKGEPTLNKSLPDMIKYAHSNNIWQSMDTNSNQEFNDAYLFLDRINCSIDGSDEKSYSTYRRNGNWNKAIAFMRTAANRKLETKSKCIVRWKYILFDTTESIDQLNQAQKIAQEIGIDELDFVITACGAYDLSVTKSQKMSQIATVENYIKENRIFKNTVVSRS